MAVLVMACFISTTTAQMPKVDPNFKMPKNIKSYSEYLKYVGMAQGILPIEPLAEEAFAPGPSQGTDLLTHENPSPRKPPEMVLFAAPGIKPICQPSPCT